MVMGIIGKAVSKAFKSKKKGKPLKKSTITFKGINLKSKSKLGKKPEVVIEDLTTTVDVPIPKDFDVPTYIRKRRRK